jgi:lipid II:glycine glycyltransferase (peptidoglycan interpeptide bridge formation enzyme)
MFYWNRHAAYWHAAADREFLAIEAPKLLLSAIIRDACSRQIRYFDFNPSGGHAGVAKFKGYFGARQTPLSRFGYAKSPKAARHLLSRSARR